MKIFKNVRAFRFTREIPTRIQIAQAVKETMFRDGSKTTLIEWGGFVPVLSGKPGRVLSLDHYSFIHYQIESRILPGGAVRDAVDAKVRQIEEAEVRKVYAKEKRLIKEGVLAGMIPRAFTKKKIIQAVIDHDRGLIYVDARSTGDANTLLNALREGLGSLPVIPVSPRTPVRVCARTWIETGRTAPGIELGERCKLEGQSSDRIQYTNCQLQGKEIVGHLHSGLQPVSVELIVYDHDSNPVASFILNEDMSMHRFSLSDAVLFGRDNQEDDTDQAMADAAMMMHALGYVLRTLLEGLGGEQKSEDNKSV